MPKLTKSVVAAAKPNTNKEVFLWDSELRGLGLRVKPSGAKSYFLQYRNAAGRSRRLTIKDQNVLAPDEVRKQARELLVDVARGGDPAEKRSADRAALTVAELCREYLDKASRGLILTQHQERKKASTLYTDAGRIERHIIPLLGRRKVKDLTAADVRAFQRDVTVGKTAVDVRTKERGRSIVKGGSGTASRTLGLLGGIFAYAQDERYRPDNPCRGVKRPKDRKRQVRLDEAEYRQLGELLADAERKRCCLAGNGRGEADRSHGRETRRDRAPAASEVDLTAQVLRLGDTKTGASIRPIGRAAAEVLRGAMARSSGRYVFPSDRLADAPFRNLPKAWRSTIGRKLPGVTPHGLRHAYASTAEDLGFTVPTIAALLGHAGKGVAAGYIHKPDSALIAAADKVAGRIAAAIDGAASAEVIELRRPP